MFMYRLRQPRELFIVPQEKWPYLLFFSILLVGQESITNMTLSLVVNIAANVGDSFLYRLVRNQTYTIAIDYIYIFIPPYMKTISI